MTWCSQAGQDEWVHSIIGDTGFFIDIGAYDGIEHSNTYALEQLGWRGLCLEPNPQVVNSLATNRPHSVCMCTAASDRDGDLRMTGDRIDGHGPTIVKAVRLDKVLEWAPAPSIIDYLSIDVEGHELQVLAGMNFDRWHVRLATIEHNLYRDGPFHRDAIRIFMEAHGFEIARADVIAPGYGAYEDWWINARM